MARTRLALVVLTLAAALPTCRSAPARPPALDPTGTSGTPGTPPVDQTSPPVNPEDPLAVALVTEPFTVAAWAEPAKLPPLGGQCQIIVRVLKRGGLPLPGVEVKLQTSKGTLYSAGRILITDASGKTRDRLTARAGATVTLNAGGTRYRFEIPLADPLPLPE